jgi:hypothetical protein
VDGSRPATSDRDFALWFSNSAGQTRPVWDKLGRPCSRAICHCVRP